MLSSGSRDRLILQRDARTPNPVERRLIGHRQEVGECFNLEQNQPANAVSFTPVQQPEQKSVIFRYNVLNNFVNKCKSPFSPLHYSQSCAGKVTTSSTLNIVQYSSEISGQRTRVLRAQKMRARTLWFNVFGPRVFFNALTFVVIHCQNFIFWHIVYY